MCNPYFDSWCVISIITSTLRPTNFLPTTAATADSTSLTGFNNNYLFGIIPLILALVHFFVWFFLPGVYYYVLSTTEALFKLEWRRFYSHLIFWPSLLLVGVIMMLSICRLNMMIIELQQRNQELADRIGELEIITIGNQSSSGPTQSLDSGCSVSQISGPSLESDVSAKDVTSEQDTPSTLHV